MARYRKVMCNDPSEIGRFRLTTLDLGEIRECADIAPLLRHIARRDDLAYEIEWIPWGFE